MLSPRCTLLSSAEKGIQKCEGREGVPLQVEPETLGLAHGRQLADRVLLEEGGVHIGDAHQRLFPGRLVVLNRLLEGSEGGGVILGGGDEPYCGGWEVELRADILSHLAVGGRCDVNHRRRSCKGNESV